jgi:hypothetical protein
MGKWVIMFLASFFLFSTLATAQFFSNVQVSKLEYDHSTVGTTAGKLIADADVKSNLLGFHVCMDAEATATYLAVGEDTDPLTDGVRLGPGLCFVCNNCRAATLKKLRVKAQAASTGFSVIQFRQ